jgi:hypothetical protein
MKTIKPIKIIKKTSILAMLCIGLMSCNSETESLEFEEANLTSEQSKSLESTVNYRHQTGHGVDLDTAGDYAILSKSGITNISPSLIQGNVGTSPITGAALLLTCPEVTGTGNKIYTVDAAGPSCKETSALRLTTAVGHMEAAYTAAAGETTTNATGSQAFLNVGAGSIGGKTLTPGVYTWGSALLIPTDITLEGAGDPNTDEWIFQVAGTLTMSNDVIMTLDNGALAENVFWQVSGAVTLGTNSHFVGTLLGKTSIAVQTNATVNGRLLAQTAVTLQKNIVWAGSGPAPIPPTVAAKSSSSSATTCVKTAPNLGLAGSFAILSKSGITNVHRSAIVGNVGTSPITGAALLLTCSEVAPATGKIYTVDAAGPLGCTTTNASGLSTAVGDMQAAYTDLAGRCNPDFLNEGAGSIGGMTLAPGVHKWTSALLIPDDITLNGNATDVWIFQVAGTLTMSNGKHMILSGGAVKENIFWQVAGAVTLGTTSVFQGTLLGKTSIAVQTNATVNGRLLAQTAVTLQMNTVTGPSAASVPLP